MQKNGTIWSISHKKYIGTKDKDGYLRVTKPKEYNKSHSGIHQYIWMVVNKCEIPEGCDIHHIDGNPLNNSIYNLELLESSIHHNKYHKNNNYWLGKYNHPRLSKKVAQYTLSGDLVKVWDSTMEAERNGFSSRKISDCCNNSRKTHKGFIWKYT